MIIYLYMYAMYAASALETHHSSHNMYTGHAASMIINATLPYNWSITLAMPFSCTQHSSACGYWPWNIMAGSARRGQLPPALRYFQTKELTPKVLPKQPWTTELNLQLPTQADKHCIINSSPPWSAASIRFGEFPRVPTSQFSKKISSGSNNQ